MISHMDSLIVLHRLAVSLQAVTGIVCAGVGFAHIWRLVFEKGAPLLSRGIQPLPVEVVVGLIVILPAILVTVSVGPMVRGSYIAFRSGASATGVLLVALVGLLSLFGNVVTLELCALGIADLLLIATFGETRRRRRLSERGLPPGL